MSAQKVSVCQASELSEGEMQQFSVADRDVLLVRTDGEINALAATCSHYGAPLAKGVLYEGRIVCPWHNACYSAATGKQLEPPGRCDLAQYSVTVEDGTVYVELSNNQDEHVVPSMAEPSSEVDKTFVIVGGGAAGNAAAEMLRQVDYQGRIVMLTAEQEMPYDRTKLSKAFLQGDEVKGADLLRSPTFYEQHGIEIKTNAKVSHLDVEAQQLTYGSGETLKYDALLLATGGKVNKPSMDGSDLENVFTLRRIEDAQEILKVAKNSQRVVVIGTGFVGMEVASSLRQQGLEVTVVSPNEVPFEKVLGTEVGKMFQRMHESHEVTFKLGSKVTALKGDKQVESVELDTGETLPADMVVVGIGVKPATDFVGQIALNEDDNSVLVNQYLQASPGVYAAGDIAQFPHFITGKPVRIEHWRLALQHGQIAACNMAGQDIPFKAVPFFWTGQFDLKLRYVGNAEKWDDVIIQGSLDDQSFLAFYVQNDQVMAVAGAGRDQDIAAISELLRIGKMPAVSDVKQSDIDWVLQLQ